MSEYNLHLPDTMRGTRIAVRRATVTDAAGALLQSTDNHNAKLKFLLVV